MRKLLIADLKLLFRNKQSLFWAIAFPLIFTVIFGFFFGSGSFGVGSVVVVNHSSSEIAKGLVKALNDQSAFKIRTQDTDTDISSQIQKGTAAAALVIPEHFGDISSPLDIAPTNVTVIYDPGSVQTRAALEGFVSQYLTNVNFQVLRAEPTYNFVEEKANGQAIYSYFDFVLVGLVGMALMNSAIQGIAIAMSKYRDDQILKRITTTPLPGWMFITSEVLSRLVLNLVQVFLILSIGVGLFHAHLNGGLLSLVILALIGAILFQLIGFSIASVSKNTDAAEGMSQAITIPMMFLSGVFFPIDQLPNWLYSIVKYLPLSPLLRSMRSVALEHGQLTDNSTSLLILTVWIVVLLGLTVYRFRLSEE